MHTPVYRRSHSWQCMSEQKPSHEVQGIVRRALRQDCVEAQICRKAAYGLSNHEKQDSLVWWNQYLTLWPECQASRLDETWHHPYGESWWWQDHSVGMFFRDLETSQDLGKDESTERSLMKTCSRALRTSEWGKGSPSKRKIDPTAKTTRDWLQDKSLNVLEWSSQSPDLNTIFGETWK